MKIYETLQTPRLKEIKNKYSHNQIILRKNSQNGTSIFLTDYYGPESAGEFAQISKIIMPS